MKSDCHIATRIMTFSYPEPPVIVVVVDASRIRHYFQFITAARHLQRLSTTAMLFSSHLADLANPPPEKPSTVLLPKALFFCTGIRPTH